MEHWSPSDDKTEQRLYRALRVAAFVIDRYEGTDFESDAIRIFERLERELASHQRRQGAKARAAQMLDGTAPEQSGKWDGKHSGKQFGKLPQRHG